MICEREKCTGCYACYNICPKQCIEMREDELGHIYPSINSVECINCELCKKVCPANEDVEFKFPIEAYAAWSNDEVDRKSSTSGGVASVFSSYVINNQGVVFGVKFNDNLKAQHCVAQNIEQVKAFKGSKYVHSMIGDTYKQAKSFLDNNKKVLFIGTPCQIAGLLNFLGKPYENLITVDLVCHGVPPNKLLTEHIKEIEQKFNKKSTNISFRNRNNESGFCFTLYNNDDIFYKKGLNNDLYYLGFLKGLFFRNSCYSCKYATNQRVSDVTIGDFWGLGKKIPFDYYIQGGVSLILTNTDKGKAFLEECKDQLLLVKRPLEEAFAGNSQLNYPSRGHKNRDDFICLYKDKGLNYAAKKCLFKDILKYKLLSILQKNKFVLNLLLKLEGNK